MENDTTQNNSDLQVLGVKRRWTYAVIAFFMVFGCFLCSAIFNLAEFVSVFLMGLIIVGVCIFFLVTKLITPSQIITYNKKTQTIKIKTWRVSKDIVITDVLSAQPSWRLFSLVIIVKSMQTVTQAITVSGVSRPDRVAQSIISAHNG